LSGGVALYAAQTNAQIDAEIAEKGGFQTETNKEVTMIELFEKSARMKAKLFCKKFRMPQLKTRKS
jgi:hypothetical protein